MIVSWPAQITSTGLRRQYVHAVDIVPTLYSMLGIEPPDVVKGYTQYPARGHQLRRHPQRRRRRRPTSRRSSTRWAARGRSGTRAGRPPRSRRPPRTCGRTTPRQRWELFNTDEDPTECHDLAVPGAGEAAGAHPAVVGAGRPVRSPAAGEPQRPRDPHHRPAPADQAAEPVRVLPRHGRGPRVGRAEHPQPLLHHRGRGHIDTGDAGGVLFAHGARFGGHALYVKDGKLKYVYNFVGDIEQIIESTEPLPDRPRDRLGLLRA